jgi:HD superfamily phosphohydrolase YqeK
LKKSLLFAFKDLTNEFMTKPAAIKYHHAWEGGLYQHVKEVMNIALEIFEARPKAYECSRDDVITASFVHDFNKVDRYIEAPEWKKIKYQQLFDKKPMIWLNESARTTRLCLEYGIELNDTVLNAICLHHGGYSVDASSPHGYLDSGDFTKLAILLHSADFISSRVLGDYRDKHITKEE